MASPDKIQTPELRDQVRLTNAHRIATALGVPSRDIESADARASLAKEPPIVTAIGRAVLDGLWQVKPTNTAVTLHVRRRS